MHTMRRRNIHSKGPNLFILFGGEGFLIFQVYVMCTWIWTQFLNHAQNDNHKVKKLKELCSNPQLENLKKNLAWKPRSEVLFKRKNQPKIDNSLQFSSWDPVWKPEWLLGDSNTQQHWYYYFSSSFVTILFLYTSDFALIHMLTKLQHYSMTLVGILQLGKN
jgi:hypothetical protein